MSDITSAAPATPLEIPVLPAPVAQPVQEIDVPNLIPAEKISVAKTLGINIQGPKELLGEDPEEATETVDRLSGKAPRERGPDGKFIPKTDKPKEEAKVEAPKAAPAPAPKKAVPAVQKVKIGDEELTAEEITARMKDLREKAEAAAKPAEAPKVPEPEPVAKTPEQITADEQAAEAAFIAENSERYAFPQEDFDKMLASGDPKPLSAMFARAEMNARKWLASQVNPHLEKLAKNMEPVLKTHEQVQQFQTERQFLDANPEIRDHPQGLAEQREVNRILNEQHDRLQRLKNANIATPAELAQLEQFDKTTPEQWAADVAHHTRNRLGIGKTAPAQIEPKVVAPKVAAKPASEEPPNENGSRPGAARGVGKAQTEEQRMVADVMARG